MGREEGRLAKAGVILLGRLGAICGRLVGERSGGLCAREDSVWVPRVCEVSEQEKLRLDIKRHFISGPDGGDHRIRYQVSGTQ